MSISKRIIALAAAGATALLVSGGLSALHNVSPVRCNFDGHYHDDSPRGNVAFGHSGNGHTATVTGGTPGNTVTISFNFFPNGTCTGPSTAVGSVGMTFNAGGTATAASVPQTPAVAGAYSFQAVAVPGAVDTGSTSACEVLSVTAGPPVLAATNPTIGAIGCTRTTANTDIRFATAAATGLMTSQVQTNTNMAGAVVVNAGRGCAAGIGLTGRSGQHRAVRRGAAEPFPPFVLPTTRLTSTMSTPATSRCGPQARR